MFKLRKIFTCFLLTFLLFSSSVLATDAVVLMDTAAPIQESTPIAAQTISDDLYLYNTDSYTLNDNVNGNVFASSLKFTTNPRNNGGTISGNLFIISSDTVIGSDVVYSDTKDSSGNYLIKSINSKSVIKGNVYVLSDNFTLEAGSEIQGDLYLLSTNAEIQQDAIIKGNAFISSTNITLNGQVSGSAYIMSDNFTMNYLGYINRDLFLNSQNATLAGVINRNAFATVSNELITTSYFRISQNLSVTDANNFTFAGEIKGNAIINTKNLSFKNSDSEKCIIGGNLKYSTQNEITVPDGIVTGEVTSSEYKKSVEEGITTEEAIISFLTLIVYVFAIVYFFKLFAPKVMENLATFNFKNTFISFGVGFASFFLAFVLLFALLITGIGLTLSLVVLAGYLLVLGLALPVFLYSIANIIKLKLNILVRLLLVTAVYYLVTLIPVVGPLAMFIALFIGTGKILLNLFKKK